MKDEENAQKLNDAEFTDLKNKANAKLKSAVSNDPQNALDPLVSRYRVIEAIDVYQEALHLKLNTPKQKASIHKNLNIAYTEQEKLEEE